MTVDTVICGESFYIENNTHMISHDDVKDNIFHCWAKGKTHACVLIFANLLRNTVLENVKKRKQQFSKKIQRICQLVSFSKIGLVTR